MKQLLRITCTFFIFQHALAQLPDLLKNQGNDIWSGHYLLKPYGDSKLDDFDAKKIIIQKASDAAPEDLPSKYKTNAERWLIIDAENQNEQTEARTFLFNEEDDEYTEFGWSELHKKGCMECIYADHFFLCQTQPNSKIRFSDEGSFESKTGIFGVMLHYELFEMEKIKQ